MVEDSASSGRSISTSSVNQPLPGEQAMGPANPVASGEAEAGPSHVVPFPYDEEEVIGGDSVRSIQNRLLAKYDSPSAHEITMARIEAEDLMERLGNASLIEDWRGEVEWKKRLGMDLGVFVRAVCGESRTYAKILTGYEITGARSSGIFMGILSIAVGSLFKITAVPFRAAVERTAAYRCVVTQDKHAARLLAGRIEVLFRSTVHPVKCKKHSRITQRTLLVCFLPARKEERQAVQKKNRLEVRGPLVPYPTPEPAAFAPSKTALVLSPFRLLLCFVPIESKAKQKWVRMPTLPTERERTLFRFRVYGLDSVSVTPSFLLSRDALVTGKRFQRRPSRVSGCFLD
ncbi:NADH dehydrogenase I subunit 2 [Vigna unguiculata]|uniref:NADH dehydrogenase I subunit 2 n=1 Tax=Vigna unguiculata TaxID=3917 RepID=A0A4D6KUW9_VIGUN|nr:NADH dehydrogenase I subunit 2 [Vigna unguiculata]